MIINNNINDLYDITSTEQFYYKIYNPTTIKNGVIYKKYTILNLQDMPEELKLLIKDMSIDIKAIYETTKIINDEFNINYSGSIVINIKEFEELLNNFKLNFKAIYKKTNDNNTELTFDFDHDKKYIDIDINPFNKIILLIFANYVDNIVIPQIKKEYESRLSTYLAVINTI